MSPEHDPKEKEVHQEDKKETKEIGGIFGGIKKIIGWVKKAVGAIIRPFWNPSKHSEEKQALLSPELSLKLKSQTGKISGDVSALLQRDAIKNKTDRKLVSEAKAFLENPSENLEKIMKHTTQIGQVLAGYEAQGAVLPPEIDAMHGYLLTLQCVNRIHFVEKELDSWFPSTKKMKIAMTQALDWATILSRKGYKDGTFLTAVNALQERVNKQ